MRLRRHRGANPLQPATAATPHDPLRRGIAALRSAHEGGRSRWWQAISAVCNS